MDETLLYQRENWEGHPVYHFPTLDSTNIRAKLLAREGEAHGALVLADEQTQGRGRFDRKWLSRPGYGAWFTLIVRPEKGRVAAQHAGGLVFVAALAVAEALNARVPGSVTIKWPNDLVANGHKICGIMCEMSASASGLDWAVIGIGINLRGTEFPPDLPWAGSFERETGEKMSAKEAVCAFLPRFDALYGEWLEKGLSPILARIAPLSATLGRRVRVIQPDGSVLVGTAVRTLDDGALVVDHEGELTVLRAGDVSVRGMMDYV